MATSRGQASPCAVGLHARAHLAGNAGRSFDQPDKLMLPGGDARRSNVLKLGEPPLIPFMGACAPDSLRQGVFPGPGPGQRIPSEPCPPPARQWGPSDRSRLPINCMCSVLMHRSIITLSPACSAIPFPSALDMPSCIQRTFAPVAAA